MLMILWGGRFFAITGSMKRAFPQPWPTLAGAAPPGNYKYRLSHCSAANELRHVAYGETIATKYHARTKQTQNVKLLEEDLPDDQQHKLNRTIQMINNTETC